jgi:hypothetical protein
MGMGTASAQEAQLLGRHDLVDGDNPFPPPPGGPPFPPGGNNDTCSGGPGTNIVQNCEAAA